MLRTEAYNEKSQNLDKLNSEEFVDLFLEEDQQVWTALKDAGKQIAIVIDEVYKSLKNSGRLFYIGAGTSGRLGVLDASECPPTFSVDPEMVQGIIAGGDSAIRKAVEGAEDDEEAGLDFVRRNLRKEDVIIGISASGGAAYVIGALKAARELGSKTIAISNNYKAEINNFADFYIHLDTGPEIISGSTRLKAGTSQKIVLNIISTGVMVKLGKVYGNLMVDVNASNKKLIKRAKRLVQEICKCSEEEAERGLATSQFKVKQAVLKILKDWDYDTASKKLAEVDNFLGRLL